MEDWYHAWIYDPQSRRFIHWQDPYAYHGEMAREQFGQSVDENGWPSFWGGKFQKLKGKDKYDAYVSYAPFEAAHKNAFPARHTELSTMPPDLKQKLDTKVAELNGGKVASKIRMNSSDRVLYTLEQAKSDFSNGYPVAFGYIAGKLYFGSNHPTMTYALVKMGYSWDSLLSLPQIWGWLVYESRALIVFESDWMDKHQAYALKVKAQASVEKALGEKFVEVGHTPA